jgi:hypothetical protein
MLCTSRASHAKQIFVGVRRDVVVVISRHGFLLLNRSENIESDTLRECARAWRAAKGGRRMQRVSELCLKNPIRSMFNVTNFGHSLYYELRFRPNRPHVSTVCILRPWEFAGRRDGSDHALHLPICECHLFLQCSRYGHLQSRRSRSSIPAPRS